MRRPTALLCTAVLAPLLLARLSTAQATEGSGASAAAAQDQLPRGTHSGAAVNSSLISMPQQQSVLTAPVPAKEPMPFYVYVLCESTRGAAWQPSGGQLHAPPPRSGGQACLPLPGPAAEHCPAPPCRSGRLGPGPAGPSAGAAPPLPEAPRRSTVARSDQWWQPGAAQHASAGWQQARLTLPSVCLSAPRPLAGAAGTAAASTGGGGTGGGR